MSVFFSVVVPLYNKAAYIEQTLRSVLAQSFEDYEVIVVDDGSSDGSADLVMALGDSRLRVIKQANAGVSAARNRGVAEAKGQWVAFLDADDCWHPEYLASQWAAIQRHPQVDMSGSVFLPLPDQPGWPKHEWHPLPTSLPIALLDDLPTRWSAGVAFFTSSVCVRTTRLHTLQPCFPVGESLGEDLDLWFRVAEQSSFALIELPLVAYRTVAVGSLSQMPKNDAIPAYLQRMRARALAGAMPAKLTVPTLKFVADQCLTIARTEITAGHRLKAIRWMALSQGYALTKRWWVTLFMVIFVPGPAIERWHALRKGV